MEKLKIEWIGVWVRGLEWDEFLDDLLGFYIGLLEEREYLRVLVEQAHDLFISEKGWGDGAFFWAIVNGFLVADHEDIDVYIVDFG